MTENLVDQHGSDLALYPAALVALRQGDQVLLQRRQNTGYMDGYWAFGVAGKVELGESVLDTAVREADEELGVVIRPELLRPLTVMHMTDRSARPLEQRVHWFFECRSWQGAISIREPEKCSALQWFTLASLPEPMPPHELLVLRQLWCGDLATLTFFGFDEQRTGRRENAHGY